MDHEELAELREMLQRWRESGTLDDAGARTLWLIEALDDAHDAEREAIMHTGRADATTRLMALALREGRMDVAEGIAEMVLDKHDPKVIVQMREAAHGRMALVGWPAELLVRAMAEEMEASGAENYLEHGFAIRGLGFALRIERVEGKTPATIAAEARAGLAEALREVSDLRASVEHARAERDAARADRSKIATMVDTERAVAARLRTALRALAESLREEQWCGQCGARWETDHPEGCATGQALRALAGGQMALPGGER